LTYIEGVKFYGRQDALFLLMGILGVVFTSPLFFKHGPLAPFSGMVLIASSFSYVIYKVLLFRLGKNLTHVSTHFVLPSDPIEKPKAGEDYYILGLTKDKLKEVKVNFDTFVRHIAVIGASGVGKTTFGMWIMFQHIMKGGGLAFINAKVDSDARDKIFYFAKLAGRENDFYCIDIDNPKLSNTYNPAFGRKDPDEIASALLNLIASAEDAPDAAYYRNSANHALVTIIGAIQRCGFEITIEDLLIILQSSIALEWLVRKTPEGPEKRNLEIFLDKYRRTIDGQYIVDLNMLKDVLGSITSNLAVFCQGNFLKVFAHYDPDVVMDDIILNSKILYVSVPAMAKEDASLSLIKVFISDIASTASYLQANPDKASKMPFLVFADEFGSYVIKKIAIMFEQCRSANIAWMPSFQTFGNLSKLSIQFLDTVLQNTWSKVIFRFGSRESAVMAADMIGEAIKLQVSYGENESANDKRIHIRTDPNHEKTDSEAHTVSYREVKEHRISPEHISAVPKGECIITISSKTYHAVIPEIRFPPKQKMYRFKPLKRKNIVRTRRPLEMAKNYKKFVQGSIT